MNQISPWWAWAACLLAPAGAACASPEPAAPVPAVAAASAPMSLRDAWAQAWARAPVQHAMAARQEQQAAIGSAAQARLPAAPTVSIGALHDRLNRNTGRQEWEAEMSLPLWRPGQRTAQLRLAEAQGSSLEQDTRQRQLDLARDLRETWWAAAAAQGAVALAQARLEAAQALHDDVARRYRAGDVARTDANAAAIELGAAESAWLEARLEEQAAHGRVRLLTGEASAASPLPEAQAPPSLSEALARTGSHPHRTAARAAVEAAQAKLDVASRSGREAPELAVRLVRERGDLAERYANAVGVKLSVPLSSPPLRLRDTAEARAELLEAQAMLQQAVQQIALDVETAYQQRDAALARQALAARRVALAGDTLELLQKSFSLGETDLASLLRARAAAHEARVEQHRAHIAHATALSRIQQALGVLP